jgi:hypothetical protein
MRRRSPAIALLPRSISGRRAIRGKRQGDMRRVIAAMPLQKIALDGTDKLPSIGRIQIEKTVQIDHIHTPQISGRLHAKVASGSAQCAA